MSRITVSIPADVAKRIPERALSLNRSISAYVALVVAEDLRSVGLLKNGYEAEAKFWAKLRAAAKKNEAFRRKLEQDLTEAQRANLSK